MTTAAKAPTASRVESSATNPLVNDDLAPVPPAARTWNLWHIASLWVGMSVCIPSYMLAAGMIEAGLSWRMALLAVLLGYPGVWVPLVGHAPPGHRSWNPFPVHARPSLRTPGA